ncbi:MAG: HipA N-terminal domain-containing protein [Fimbriimonadaceae bacterium]|nr:HipA N-terminal domain-containing protein [Chitinophagales bacterium]
MRKAEIKFNDYVAGWLTQDETGYHFVYDTAYIKIEKPEPVSQTLPLQEAPFISKTLFPFFDGLIPEGWLLDVAEKNWKLNPRDRMGLLLACCKDCIGAVSVHPLKTNEE